MVRIQLVSRGIPYGDDYGGRRYVSALLEYLTQQHFEIECTILDPCLLGRLPRVGLPIGVRARRRPVAWGGFGGVLWRFARETLRERLRRSRLLFRLEQPLQRISVRAELNKSPWDVEPDAEEVRWFLAEHERLHPDVVLVNHAWLLPLFDALPAGTRARKVVLLPDILHQRVDSFRRIGQTSGHRDWSASREKALWKRAQILLPIHRDDARVLRNELPDRTILPIGVGTPVKNFSPSPVSYGCLFVGSDAPHNVDGLRWFLAEIWPRIRARLPRATLTIAGAVGGALSGLPRGARRLGFVSDLTAQYAAAALCVVPLRAGSGLKIKMIEAFANGRTCVATPVGAQGLESHAATCFALSDSAESFAEQTIRLLLDHEKRRALENAAAEFVRVELNPGVVYAPLCRLLAETQR